jgi:hypothetical protein
MMVSRGNGSPHAVGVGLPQSLGTRPRLALWDGQHRSTDRPTEFSCGVVKANTSEGADYADFWTVLALDSRDAAS